MRISKHLGERLLKSYSKIRHVGYMVCGRCDTQMLFVPGDYWDMEDMDNLRTMRQQIRELEEAADTLERVIRQDAKKPLTDADQVILYRRGRYGERRFIHGKYGSGLCIREARVFNGVSEAIAYRDTQGDAKHIKMGRYVEVPWRGQK